MGAGCVMDHHRENDVFLHLFQINTRCELIMLATGVFAGEQKSEAKKRCERAKPNAAGL